MNWENQLPGPSPGSSFLKWNFLGPKKVELFLYTSSLVACPFQMQYSLKSWHHFQEYLLVYFDHKSLEADLQV